MFIACSSQTLLSIIIVDKIWAVEQWSNKEKIVPMTPHFTLLPQQSFSPSRWSSNFADYWKYCLKSCYYNYSWFYYSRCAQVGCLHPHFLSIFCLYLTNTCVVAIQQHNFHAIDILSCFSLVYISYLSKILWSSKAMQTKNLVLPWIMGK